MKKNQSNALQNNAIAKNKGGSFFFLRGVDVLKIQTSINKTN
ncbi:hypothetical protein [Flavobacterium defluvii]|uniref:Uncharacterized protein n=1 Tax=Flavobacterium defluvii TaxID=370979 RepID=A0A1M5V452_9FLAO|nr:hypothetical protein [Flavobacterium defluvii]SHH70047.1 hypothetical protein SAMN05443663_11015 [Flavobacterium defluvii]